MITRHLPCCLLIVAACGPEVTAREVPSLDELAGAGAPMTALASRQDVVPAALATPTAEEIAAAAAEGADLTLPALLYSDLDAEVAARADGVVLTIAAELGDEVRAGQVLARLDDAREAARVAAATAALERARADHARAEGLQSRGFVTTQELDAARYELTAAEAALRVAQVDLEHTRVVAPFGGVVTRRHAGVGRTVAEGDALFRVTALRPLRATARLPERDARGLRAGAIALLTDSYGASVEARVIRVSPAVEPGSGTVEVIVSVPQPGPFLPGSSAILRLPRPEVAARTP